MSQILSFNVKYVVRDHGDDGNDNNKDDKQQTISYSSTTKTIEADSYTSLLKNIRLYFFPTDNFERQFVVLQSRNPWDDLPVDFKNIEKNLVIYTNDNNNNEQNNMKNKNNSNIELSIENILNMPDEKFLGGLLKDNNIQKTIENFLTIIKFPANDVVNDDKGSITSENRINENGLEDRTRINENGLEDRTRNILHLKKLIYLIQYCLKHTNQEKVKTLCQEWVVDILSLPNLPRSFRILVFQLFSHIKEL